MNTAVGFATLALAASLLTGCSEKRTGPEIVNVEGTLTVDGEPMEDLRIEFWPQDVEDGAAGRLEHGSAGKTDADGHFVLEAADGSGEMGAVVGTHQIVIRDLSNDIPMGRLPENHSFRFNPRISVIYSHPITSGLTQKIDGPRSDLKFDVRAYDTEEIKRLKEQ